MPDVTLNVRLLAGTRFPEQTIALGGRLCYSDAGIDELAEKSAPGAEKFVDKLMALGHLSPIEHASFTFGIEGVSRTLLAQITRHRIASFSVQSQRYVTKDSLTYITPPSITALGEAAVQAYQAQMDASFSAYESLLKQGVPAEDARFLLPGGAETRMILTMNARELLHFFELRCCERAQWEIRALAWCMLGIARREAPAIFASGGPACISTGCHEGRMSCKKAAAIKERSCALDALIENGADDCALCAWARDTIYKA